MGSVTTRKGAGVALAFQQETATSAVESVEPLSTTMTSQGIYGPTFCAARCCKVSESLASLLWQQMTTLTPSTGTFPVSIKEPIFSLLVTTARQQLFCKYLCGIGWHTKSHG